MVNLMTGVLLIIILSMWFSFVFQLTLKLRIKYKPPYLSILKVVVLVEITAKIWMLMPESLSVEYKELVSIFGFLTELVIPIYVLATLIKDENGNQIGYVNSLILLASKYIALSPVGVVFMYLWGVD